MSELELPKCVNAAERIALPGDYAVVVQVRAGELDAPYSSDDLWCVGYLWVQSDADGQLPYGLRFGGRLKLVEQALSEHWGVPTSSVRWPRSTVQPLPEARVKGGLWRRSLPVMRKGPTWQQAAHLTADAMYAELNALREALQKRILAFHSEGYEMRLARELLPDNVPIDDVPADSVDDVTVVGTKD
jgi:hypothetical protein